MDINRVKKLEALRDRCRWAASFWTNDLIEVGDFTYGMPIVHQWDKVTRLKIGKFCSIAGNVNILLGGEHHTEWISTYPFDVLIDGSTTPSKGDVIIGNDVWIGQDVTILSGVTIGDGAVIGAGSVVTKRVHDFEIVGGSPAEFIRYRATGHNVKWWHLLKWWDWPLEKIAEAYPLIMSENVHGLIEFSSEWDVKHGGDG